MIFFSETNFFYLAVLSKWVKLGKRVINKHKNVLSLPKNQNKLKNYFLLRRYIRKTLKFWRFWVFPIRKLTMCKKNAFWIKLIFFGMLHLYSFSPVWIIIWTLRYDPFEKVSLLCLHWYSFSPVWTLLCFTRSQTCANGFSHWLHWYGFSPECIFMWLKRLPFW